jgi:hypothetical protein
VKNPADLSTRMVAMLKSIPGLVTALGSADYITAHYDSYPEISLSEAIYTMAPPSILVVWDGSGPAPMGTREVWSHSFRMILRAKAETPDGTQPDGYYQIWTSIVNGVPSIGDGQSLRLTEFDTGVYPINQFSIRRAQMLVDPATATALEYFEVTFNLTERGQ